jgi:hypothetical protein
VNWIRDFERLITLIDRNRFKQFLGRPLLSLALGLGGIALIQTTAGAGTSTSLNQIKTEIKAAIRLDSLPTDLHPSTSQWTELWQKDFGAVATGGGNSPCWDQLESSSSLSTCVFGDPTATRTLVLTGDSQAWMWEPAFDKWGRSSHWKVIVLAKGSCQPWPDSQQEFVNNSAFPACGTFQSKVEKYINMTHPSVVVAAGLVPVIPAPSVSRVKSDVATFVTSIAKSHARVLIVNPSPSFYAYDYTAHSTLSAPTCLSTHSAKIRACDGVENSQLLDYFMNAVINESRLPGNSQVLNLGQLLCNSQCPMISGSPRVCVGDFGHATRLVVGSSIVRPPQQR